ncbi:MAG: hypothetical protein U0232_19130 [Thermomicrobiales bacterium]
MASIAESRGAGRPTMVTVAVALLIFTGVLGLLAAPAGLGEVGLVVLIPALVFAGLRFISAYWLWRGQRWAAVLGFVATLLDTLLALPGLSSAPNGMLQVMATIGVVIGIPMLVLLGIVMFRRIRA